jgi:hypothetical protein
LSQWTKNTPYTVGTIIQPATIVQGTPPAMNVFMYTCTTPGTSGGTEPTWGTVANGTTSDGSAVWTANLDKLAIDSDDPNGLATPAMINETSPQNFHTFATYHVPLIVSCGTDGVLGLNEPYQVGPNTQNPQLSFGNLAQPQFDTTDPTGFARNAMYDNITNHQK